MANFRGKYLDKEFIHFNREDVQGISNDGERLFLKQGIVFTHTVQQSLIKWYPVTLSWIKRYLVDAEEACIDS